MQFDSLLASNELADPVTSIGPYIFAKGTVDKGTLFAWVLGLAYLVLCLPMERFFDATEVDGGGPSMSAGRGWHQTRQCGRGS
jgi:hypothetical protein